MKSLLLTLFTFSVLLVSAADSTLTWKQLKITWPVERLDLQDISLQTESNLIKLIRVLDMRSDTELLGLYTSKSQKPHAIKANESLESLLNQKLVNNTQGYELLFVIKSFWINEVNTTFNISRQVYPSLNGGATSYGARSIPVSTTKMKCAIDIFINSNEQYYPLVRLDTLLTSNKKVNKVAEKIINTAFELINQKVTTSINLNRYTKRKSGSIKMIAEEYSNIFNIPMLKEPNLKKGVYLTWDQFKNNQPDNTDFVIQQNEKEPPTLYLKNESGDEILTKNVFALSDGKKLYKVQDGYVFEMFLEKNSIYWMGVERRDVTSKSIPILLPGGGITGFGTESIGTKVKISLTPYLMNLETGQAY